MDCPNRDYPDGIVYGLAGDSSNISHGVPQTLNLLGHSSGPITLTAGARGIAFGAQASGGSGLTLNIGGATGGTAHVVRFVQGTNSVSGIDRNNGIYILRTANNTGASTTLNVRAGVTIGTMATPMKQHGIFLRPHADRPSAGRGNAGLTLTTAATIHAAGQGIRIVRQTGGTNDATTVTNTGALHSGVGNAAATGSYFDRPHGIYVLHGGTQFTGSLTVDNDGDITVGGAYTGILLRYWGAGALSLDNSGDIGAATGQTAKQGIQFNFSYWDNQSAQAVTLTNSGDITASDFGIRLKKLSGGDVELTNSGAITVTGDAAQHVGHAIYLAEGVTFGEGRTYAANSGDITVDNSGALSSKNHALYVYRPTTTTGNVADDFELTNSGAITSEEGDGIRIERPDGTGDMTIDNSGAITAGVNAIWIDEILTPATTGTVSVTHSAGALSAGRSGIVVQVASSATAATVTPRSSSAPQPLIDVAWGSTASSGATARGTTGTTANDDGRFAAPLPLDNLLPLDQEAAAVKAVEGTLHYGGPAGIEAYAISWRDVVEVVAKGDDPGAFANNAAQLTAVPTGATAADNAYVAQFRAALENTDLELATLVYNAVKSGAASLSDLSDADIVTFLRVNNGGRRTLLRNILAQGLSDDEKAILRAVATNDGVDAALTAAGFTDDTSDPNDYWSLVKALLDRYNVGDIHVNVHSGSLTASRGDGIRAYYATPNDNNGAISVTIAAGASVVGAGTGIYVANAGGDVTVESGGTIRGGTDGIRVIKPGTSGDLTITTTGGSITATAGAGIHPQDNAGHTGTVTVTNAGDITAGTWGILANRLGAGTVSVTSSGGTVFGMTEPGIFAANKAGDASDLSVDVTGGAVRSAGRNKAGIRAWNRGTGDLDVTLGTGAGAISKHGAGVFATLGEAYSTTDQVGITQGGAIQGRTGVYVEVAHGATAATPTARAAGAQPLIDVTWTGTFSHGTAATVVAPNDNGRFAAASVAEVLSFDQEAEAVKALDGSLRYGGAAGVDAHALSWRDVVAQVAKGDDPGAFADASAQQTAVPATATASDNDYVKQFKEALGNADLAVEAAVLTAIGSTATTAAGVTDAEIRTYLRTDSDATRALLRNVLAQGLSDKEKAVLLEVAAGTTTSLATALADADAAFSTAYKNAVNALLNLYNVGNIEVDMTGGSITATRGDGIRAWYATPHANNGAITVSVAAGASVSAGKAGVYVANAGGAVTVTHGGTITAGTYGIYVLNAGGAVTVTNSGTVTAATHGGVYVANSGGDVTVTHSGTVTGGTYGVYVSNAATSGAIEVTVAAGASVTGGTAGVYVANAADGLTLARKYTYGFAMGQGATADQAIAVADSGGASLLDQVVTVAGTVTGGTDAGVRLSGGAVVVMADGEVRAGSSGVGILADGAALVYVDGEVWGGAGGAAAVHLSGGGDVTVGLNGRVRANGATNAIQSDGSGTDRLTLITESSRLTEMIPYRDYLLAQVDGSLSGIDSARLIEHLNGVPTGYSLTLGITSDGMLDTSKLPSRPTSYECAGGRCDITEAGTVASRRTGVYAAVKDSTTMANQTVIDVTWSGTFSQGAVSSTAVRIAAATARDALVADREAAAGQAVEEIVHWGGPAGIEAHALSWRDVAEQVAKGDDPGAIADATAQGNLLSTTHADSRRAAILAQFRAALGNADLAVAASVLTAIDSSATSVSDLSDAEIVEYLDDDNEVTRALLRNILAQGLSDKEKAVLEAVAAGDSAALTTALDDTDAGFSAAYKTAVRALLDRRNVGNIRVRMNGGSIVSRGDGIRAYYATPHANNGAIEVTVAAGARVTADRAGIHVANAGGAVTVTNRGTITADTYGIHVDRLGSGAVSVTNAGTITADTHGIYVANAGGAVTVANSGTVTADTHGIYVADAGGAVTVTNSGTVTADTYGIYVADAGGAVTVSNSGTVRADTYGIHVVKPGTSGDVTITTTGGSITATADTGIGIYPQDNVGHTGTVTVSNGGDVTAPTWGIYANRLGSGAVSVTNTGGTVLGMTEPGIFAANKLGDASTVTVRVTGGTVRSEGRNKPAIRARNSGTGDLDLTIAAGATAISKHAAGVFATLDDAAGNRVEITQGGTILGRTGVYARVAHGTTAETVTPREASAQPLIGVTWTGAFSHGTTADVAPDDEGRFQAGTAGEVLTFDRESAAVKAVEETVRWGAPAGIEAEIMSWRHVARVVATGDDPDPAETMTNTEQMNLLSETHADSRRTAILEQFRAALGNDEIEVESSVITAIETDGTEGLSDAEIVTYLSADNGPRRTLLRNILAQGLSDDEKSILRAVATNDGVDDALTDAGFSDDTSDDDDYWSRVKALLDRYNVGNINVAMTGGSIDSRGDGIRAWYATPNANNGGISVTVAKGATVTGAIAGIYVANAGEGLRIPKRYAPNAIRALAGNADAGEDDLIAIGELNAAGDAIETPYLDQLVTVAGTVTGGTDAAVHLSGGGAVVVMEGGQVLAGSSGVAIKVNDPGPAHLFIDGEVRGRAPVEGEAPARAAVDLPGGGRVIVGRNGRVQADGAANAIRGGDDEETMVALTIATGTTAYRDVVEVQVEGSVEGVEEVRLREYRDGVPTGYDTGTLMVTDGTLDIDHLPLAPCPEDRPRDARGQCPTPTTDMDGIRIFFTGGGGMPSRDVDGIGIRARYETPHDDNGGISVDVAAGASVTGSETGVYVANAGPGLRIPKRYAPVAIRALAGNADAGEDDLIAIGRLNAAGDAIETPYLDQLVTVAGTVTGGTDAAVHLNGGGAVIVLAGGKVHAGSSGVAIKVNDPGPAHLFIAGEVRGGAGPEDDPARAAVDLPVGGSVIIGREGKVEANGAENAIQGGDTDETMVPLILATGATAYAEDVKAQVEGSLAGVEDDVLLLEYQNDAPTGYSTGTVTITDDGTLDTSRLDSRDRRDPRDGESEGRLTLKCEEAWDRRCRLYEALPSVLLAMNDQPSYAERMSAARDGNGGWARVEMSRGEWQAKKAMTATTADEKLAYDHRRSAVRAGVDLHAGESARVGVSMHALRGKAEMGGVGEVELDGMGGGLSATWLVGGLYVDAQAAMTLYDVDVESDVFGKMSKKDVHGTGYGLEVEVGRRMGVGGMFVTPRAGLEWSKVELDEFMDMERAGGPRASVSVEEADSVKGRLGVMLEAEMGSGESSGRVFASLDVEQEFTEETEVKVDGELLKTEVRPTAVRLGLGGEFAVAEDMVVRGTAGFRTSGSGTSGYSGGLELQMRF